MSRRRRSPSLARLEAQDTEDRAIALVMALAYTLEAIDRESSRHNSQIEALLRELLRERSDGAIEFRLFSPRRDPGSRAASAALDDGDADDLDFDDDSELFYELPLEELTRRFQTLPPDVPAKFLPPGAQVTLTPPKLETRNWKFVKPKSENPKPLVSSIPRSPNHSITRLHESSIRQLTDNLQSKISQPLSPVTCNL